MVLAKVEEPICSLNYPVLFNMKKNIVAVAVFLGAGLMSVYAALDPNTVLQKIVTEIFSPIYKAVVAFAFVYFLYGAFKYVYDMNHPAEKNTGKQHLFWGLVGLFFIFSVGGILALFTDIFGPLGFN